MILCNMQAMLLELILLAGNLQAFAPMLPGAQPDPFIGVFRIDTSILSPPVPVFHITLVQLIVWPGAAVATATGSPTVSPVSVVEPFTVTPAVR